MPLAVDFGGHAVGTPKIAAIDHGNPKITQPPTTRILQRTGCRNSAD
jgi:hypothetical protein